MKCSPYIVSETVQNQHECQAYCLENSECVGLLYSHKAGYGADCMICTHDNLLSSTNSFGFYRRPGSVQGYAF